jgi:hypothetical protein
MSTGNLGNSVVVSFLMRFPILIPVAAAVGIGAVVVEKKTESRQEVVQEVKKVSKTCEAPAILVGDNCAVEQKIEVPKPQLIAPKKVKG